MKTIRRPNQYLQRRGEVWHYVRRVPSVVVNTVGHEIISRSLETDSVSLARRRRDMCAEADETRWHKLMPSAFKRPSVDRSMRQARKDASAMGFAYKPEVDYGLRCTLMGHRNPRPEYGDGGSLSYRRNELMKITHPVTSELLSAYPFTVKL